MKQLNLFGDKRLPAKHRKRKYSMKHWSYRQRFTHLLSSKSKMLSAKQVKKLYLLDIYFIKQGKLPSLPANDHQPIRRGHTPFKKTVNQSRLNKAVHAMYLRKHKHYPLSINKICKKFHVSKPSLYRGYKAKYTDK